MRLFEYKEEFLLEGLMPERALLRLRRAGISLYHVKKIKKNQILFHVKRKDSEKVFAIYPNLCYNKHVYSSYAVRRTAAVGIGKYIELAKRRVGMLLGGLLCVCLIVLSEPLVFDIEFTGTNIYAREGRIALAKEGIAPFRPYPTGREDLVCSQLLSLEGVEFCSVKKIGRRVVVETRLSPFLKAEKKQGSMTATRSGTIVSMAVLRGSPLKNVGDEVLEGDPLVGDWFEGADGGQVRVELIARVRIACTYEGRIEASSQEEAFAKAYLALELAEGDVLTKTEITKNNELYLVIIDYERVETWNL